MNDFLYVLLLDWRSSRGEYPLQLQLSRSTAHYPSIYSVLSMANEAD